MSELTTEKALEVMGEWEANWSRPDPLQAVLVMKALREEIYRLQAEAELKTDLNANMTNLIDILTDTRDVLGIVIGEQKDEIARLKAEIDRLKAELEAAKGERRE